MKKVSKLMALALALFMVLSLAAPAKAANYEPVAGTYALFDKYLVLDDDADVPGVVFSYTIEGTDGKDADPGNEFEVIKTTGTTMPTMYQVADAAAAATATAPVAEAQKKLTFVKGETKTATKGTNDSPHLVPMLQAAKLAPMPHRV